MFEAQPRETKFIMWKFAASQAQYDTSVAFKCESISKFKVYNGALQSPTVPAQTIERLV